MPILSYNHGAAWKKKIKENLSLDGSEATTDNRDKWENI